MGIINSMVFPHNFFQNIILYIFTIILTKKQIKILKFVSIRYNILHTQYPQQKKATTAQFNALFSLNISTSPFITISSLFKCQAIPWSKLTHTWPTKQLLEFVCYRLPIYRMLSSRSLRRGSSRWLLFSGWLWRFRNLFPYTLINRSCHFREIELVDFRGGPIICNI